MEQKSREAELIHSHTHVLPYLALLIGVLSISFSAIWVKWANVPGPVAGFYRVAIAATVMAVPFGVQAKRQAPFAIRHVIFAILAGLFFAGDLASWNSSVLLTSAANATLLGNTAPLWVGIGSWLIFKERLRGKFWSGLLLAMLGAAIILGEDLLLHPAFSAGDLLALLAGIFYGAFMLAAFRARQKLPALVAWWISAVTSALVLLAFTFIFNMPLLGYSAQTYLALTGLALVSQVSGYLAINYALGHLRASIVSPSLLGQPVLTALIAVPLLGQSLGIGQIAGGALVLAGIWIVHRTS
ncbi:MAG: DMT family transporter [Chloroflexi bacterium]|nr:DMT family transporter [Chloroflexota bacterium]